MAELEQAAEAAPITVERSADAAVDRAFEKAFSGREEPAAEAETPEVADAPAEGGPARGPDGKFVAKQAEEPAAEEAHVAPAPALSEPPAEAPGWLSDPSAKAEWEKVPAPVQAQVNRRIGELESGLQQYRQQLEPLRGYAEAAKQSGLELPTMLGAMFGHDQACQQDIVGGLAGIAQAYGYDLRQVAAHVMGQPYDGNADAQGMRQEIARLRTVEHQFQSFQQQAQARAEQEAQSRVEAFASEHPRFNDLAPVIGWALQSGLALNAQGQPDLQLAYEYAERLRPAPQQPATAAPAAPAAKPAAAQTRKADISPSGAPGSNPVRQRSRNSDEAIDRAFDQVGL